MDMASGLSLLHTTFTSLYILFSSLRIFITIVIVNFPLVSIRHSLASGVYIAQLRSVLRPMCKHLTVLQIHIYNFKLLKILKVLKITTCFGQYGHPQALKSSGGNCCYSAAIACVLPMRTCVVLGVLCSLLFSVVCWVLI
jgi:hypothetical protein